MEFHFRDAITLENLITVMEESFPALKPTFLEYDLHDIGEYQQEYFTYVFNPFLKDFLQSPIKHPTMLGKLIFHYLERMARSPEWPVTNILAVVILEHMDLAQLEVANLYMGPKTKQVLHDIQQYWKDRNAAQR